MFRLLLIVGFIASIGVNSLAGVNPHLEGEGGCSASCCRAAHKQGQESTVSRFCCLIGCKQSSENHQSTTTQIAPAKKKDIAIANLAFNPEAAESARHSTILNSPSRTIFGSSDRYLEIGSLLI